jgi:hypothetical protein
MICASNEHEKNNGEEYQHWDVPVGQDTTAVNVDHLLQRALHSHRRYSARSSLALASVVIKVNHTRAQNINLRSDLVAVFHSGRSLANLADGEHSYLSFIGTAYADKTAPTVLSTKTSSFSLNCWNSSASVGIHNFASAM